MIFDVNFTDRQVVIVGGGKVAYRKACAFLNESAIVTLIAPVIKEDCRKLPSITIIEQSFSWDLLKEKPFLIYAACDDEQLQRQIQAESKKRHILFGSSMHIDGDVQSMMQMQKEHIQIGISTRGFCPSATRSFLTQLQPQVMAMEELSKHLNVIRQCLLKRHVAADDIKEIISCLAMLDVEYATQMIAALQGKQVLLLAVHGVADGKQIEKAFACLCSMVERELSYCARFVYISEKITQKAHEKLFKVAHVKTLVYLYERLSIPVVIQPLLFSERVQFALLKEYAPYAQIRKPLLSNVNRQKELLDIICDWFPIGSIVCIVHEEELKIHDNDRLTMIALHDEVPSALPSSCNVVPLFLLYGYHMKQDVEKHWLPIFYANCKQVSYDGRGLLGYEGLYPWIIEQIKQLANQKAM